MIPHAGEIPGVVRHEVGIEADRGLRWCELPEVSVPLRGEPLDLPRSLSCGQAFRWRAVGNGTWEGIAGQHAWQVRVDEGVLTARAAPAMPDSVARAFLFDYFALGLPAREIQDRIARSHPLAARAVSDFEGLRILRQDPLETIMTFTIATATNVPRVSRSIAALSQRFGDRIAVVDGMAYHACPTLDAILAAPLGDLFGACNLAYRARSIKAVAGSIQERPEGWVGDLTELPYADAHRALDALPFLGPKVSDCICLFGLGHGDAVPVDVHVWAIAHELFGEDIPTRTLTRKTYQRIGERFRALFSPWAGWAQQYLFCARRALPINQRYRPNQG